jgi:hypothetical protein
MEQGNFGQAGVNWTECGGVQEKIGTPAGVAGALESYDKAVNCFGADTSSGSNRSRMTGVRVKMAKLHTSGKAYDKAALVYDRLTQDALHDWDSPAARWMIVSYMYEGFLCRMAAAKGNINMAALETDIERAGDACPAFAGSREQTFVRTLASAMAEGNEEAFADVTVAHDAVCPLDALHFELLLEIKRSIGQAAVEGDQVGV